MGSIRNLIVVYTLGTNLNPAYNAVTDWLLYRRFKGNKNPIR